MKQTKKHLTIEGFSTILTYYAAINNGLSPKVTKYYPNIKVMEKPNIKLPLILNPYWVSGFVAGDGGFTINIRTRAAQRPWFQPGEAGAGTNKVEFRFHVAQHSKDFNLLKLFISFFNSGNVYLRSNVSTPRCDFVIQNYRDILNNVITHFDKYPLENVKQLDYDDFKQALLIFKSKESLKSKDLEKIKELKTGMNSGRIH